MRRVYVHQQSRDTPEKHILPILVFVLMKLYTFLQCIAISAWAISPGNAATTAYKTCRKLPKDPDWPSPKIWEAALPGVIPIQHNATTGPLPNYRFRAHSIEDVQAAVQFAAEQNVRLSVITTGHDQLGRSDAGSGLLLDLSFLRGVKIHESFISTESGTDRLNHSEEPNVITPVPGVQAAVTFGPAAAGLYLNYALDPSGLFTVSGAAGKCRARGDMQKFALPFCQNNQRLTWCSNCGCSRRMGAEWWLRATHLSVRSWSRSVARS